MNTIYKVISRSRFIYSTDLSFTVFLLPCKELETRLRTWQTRSFYFWSSHSKCSGTISNTQRLFIVVVGFSHHITAYPGVPCSLSLESVTHALFPHLISTSSTQGSYLREQIPGPTTCSLDQSFQSLLIHGEVVWWWCRLGNHWPSYQSEADDTGAWDVCITAG